ncbi:MAG TPA: tetratricopeptide repeat protein [Prolixibacteraceae bacterium]|nr:tetratricopeptide repeat protein [Prolixibacteraceae bacterium]
MKSIVRLLVLFFFAGTGLYSQANDLETLKNRFQTIFLAGQIQQWQPLVDSLRNEELNLEKEEVLLYGEYGLIGYYLGYGDRKRARKELDLYTEHVERCLEKYPRNATFLAFRAAVAGFSIWLSPLKALYLGVENQHYIDKSLEFDKNEPMPLFEYGNSLFFRPALFGGDKDKAIKLYTQVISMYQNDDPANWMYYHVRTWMGQVYTRMGEKEKARNIYQNILKDVPNYQWVRDELLPDLDKDKKRFFILNLE